MPPEKGEIKRDSKCLLTNADQLTNKMRELELVCSEQLPDIIGVVEVVPKNARAPTQSVEIQLAGYSNFDVLCRGSRGLSMYHKEGLKVSLLTPEVVYRDSIWIDTEGGARYGLIYRSPSNNEAENESLLRHLKHMLKVTPISKDLIIMGDFNLPGVDWDTLQSKRSATDPSTVFLDFFLENQLLQHVSKPTRYRGGQRPSLLELVLTRQDGLVDGIEYLPHLGESDHLVLMLTISTGEQSTVDGKNSDTEPKLNYGKADFEKMRQNLNVECLAGCSDLGVDAAWNAIKKEIKNVERRYTPVQGNRKARKKPIWTNPQALRKLRRKKDAFTRYLRTKEGEDYVLYQNAKRESRRATREAARQHEARIALDSRRNPKRFWTYVRKKSKKKCSIPDIRANGKVISDDKEKAEEFNKFFTSVFKDEPDFDEDTINVGDAQEDFTITTDQVEKKLRELKTDKSPGPDGLHPKVLKELASELAPPLTALFNKSLGSGQVPMDWKKARICPIHKKDQKYLVGNYRPVSLTSVVCKIMEGIVRDNVMGYLLQRDKITESQYGFVQGKSTLDNLLKCNDDWTKILDRGGCVDVLFLDFRKAFDSVPHRRLMAKIRKLGVNERCARWVENFLGERSQFVQIGGGKSSLSAVTSGVPQGSVLGPLLFVMFINDLPTGIKNTILMFADDVKLYREVRLLSDCESLQEDLDRLDQWGRVWALHFNAEKCMLLRMGRRPPPFKYYIGGRTEEHEIKPSDTVKDLGYITSRTLDPAIHINQTCASATRVVFTIKRTMRYLDQEAGKLLFSAMVRSMLEYGAAAWNPYKVKDVVTLEKVQRRFTKMLSGLSNLTYGERLRRLNLFSLEHRRRRGDMVTLYTLFEKNSPLLDTYRYQQNEAQVQTRGHSRRLKSTRANTNMRKNSFFVRVSEDWNALPEHVVSAPTFTTFKARLDRNWRDRDLPGMFGRA